MQIRLAAQAQNGQVSKVILRRFRIVLLNNLRLFLTILEKGSLAAAGREAGLSPATVTERLTALEGHYGTRLLNRTTRVISLTEEGRALAEGARRLLAESDALETRIKYGTERVAGPIRLSAPVDLGRTRIAPVLEAFQATHPHVTFDLHLHDGYVDIAGQGLDLAIRFGDLADSNLRARRLTSSRRLICAAPAYLDRCGTPEQPSDLVRHNCLLMRFGTEIDRLWPFQIDGRVERHAVRGNRVVNDGALVREWAVAGHGIVRKSEWDVAEDIATGRLVPILQPFAMPGLALQAVFPEGRADQRRIRLLLNEMVNAFQQQPWAVP